MSNRRLNVYPAAKRDIRSAVLFYREEAGVAVAARFATALEHQYRTIARDPGVGSPRYAGELGIEGLRHSLVKRFPYSIFYLAFDDRIEILRVLHAMRDIPANLRS
ncbi:type II toxin-antitoxin system RelE/ParE family toxin [Sphingomonas sp. LB-2]|uniref:type II toxin-antitoxin system RelE/ParE family toxin n=1 Tax=Sphingomonas caeni TaxID=2984949 RepID=UPI00222EB9BF|nr:type II toxin-antitoxin system RelE/ParE family toxin [Sphingomonas caeni]MCW3847783.1 type II toxin-antitoxin system RelE/ParE family toxin [Sphingomonas caeni]